MQIIQSRRSFLASVATAGAVGLPRWIGDADCWAGLYTAEELLRAEGFTDVRYVRGDPSVDFRCDRWRDYDAETSLLFDALRLQEAGMIKSSPREIIANGTGWRFLKELKRELKS